MADGTISIDVELNEKEFKSSLENMGGIVKLGADSMIKSVNNLSNSFVVLPETIALVFAPISDIINGVIKNILGKIPAMTKAGTALFTSLAGDISYINDEISNSANDIVSTAMKKIIEGAPDMKKTGSLLFGALISNMPGIISAITEKIPVITEKIAQKLADDTLLMAQTGFEMFCSITKTLPFAIKEIVKAPGKIVSELVAKFDGFIWQFNVVGENIVFGIWDGMSSQEGWLTSQITDFIQRMVDTAKSALGIQSPSKVFRDLVGKNIALGISAGIGDEIPGVNRLLKTQMNALVSAAFDSSALHNNAADIIGRSNSVSSLELRNILKNRSASEAVQFQSTAPEINVTLEPTGDIRGFFDYISMGVKRSEYLKGSRGDPVWSPV